MGNTQQTPSGSDTFTDSTPEGNTSRPTDKLIEQTFEYLTLEEGTPKEVSDTFYLHFTFGTISEMYKRMGVDESKARDLVEDMDAGDEEAAKKMQEEVVSSVEKTDIEINLIMVWAAIQWHARQEGRTITLDDVGGMLDADNAEEVLINTQRALEVFQSGTLPTYEEMLERREDTDEDDTAGKGSRPSNADAQRSPR